MYKNDDVIKCVVSGFKEYGIFVKVDEKYDGLIHISEISESFVKNVSDYAEIGEEIYAKILEIDEKNHQLKLSIKNLNYKIDGKDINDEDLNGFMPLKKNLNIWINDKIKEIKSYND